MRETISDKLTKRPWLRRVYPDKDGKIRGRHKPVNEMGAGRAFIRLSQDDFLNEINPSSHAINSDFSSRRPIWGPTGKKDKNGNEEWALIGYDDLVTVALGWQEFIVNNKIAHLATKGFWIANETRDQEAFEILLSYMDSAGIKDAYFEACDGAERTGDAGLYIYQDQTGHIEYQVFSFEHGYTVYPQIDEDGNEEYYVAYTYFGRQCVDIYNSQSIETWVHEDAEPQKKFNLFDSLEKEESAEKTTDGWTLLRRKAAQTGSDLCQFVYIVVPDIASGPAEQSIEELENAASYSGEEVKNSCFPILFVKSEKIVSLPPSSMNGKTLAVKGTSETIKNSDAKFLNPGDPSNLNAQHIKELKENILRSTQSVIIEPDIMKQGADSSTAIKILFRPEISWGTRRWKLYYAKPTRKIIEICKRLVGKITEEGPRFNSLRTSCGEDIWIPQNQQEKEKMVLDRVYARVMSRKAAMQELGNQYIGDYAQIAKEWEEELDIKARIPAKYKQTAVTDDDDPNPANVTNQAAGKTIQE